MKKLKFVCISDTHCLHKYMEHPVPDGDVLLIAGDMSNFGSVGELEGFNEWLGTLSHRYKICIAGNHDLGLDSSILKDTSYLQYLSCLTNVTHYLEQYGCTIEGINIWGEPRQPEFFNWAFNVPRKGMREVWKKVPRDTHILLTHGPPLGYGDVTRDHVSGVPIHVGCFYQAQLIEDEQRLPHLKAVVCGHIHEGYGSYPVNGREDITVYNVSICNKHQKPWNKPVTFDIEIEDE
jgi:Icc-related predicted phosphoesterase